MRFNEFFKRRLLVASIYNIPVRIEYRWFFVLVLMTWITASGIHSFTDDTLTSLIFGLAATLLFFASIFLHEFAHAVAARMESVEVLEIVLHPFGGLARFRREPDTMRAEFRIAAAGPAASFLIALFFFGLTVLFNSFGKNILTPLFFTLCFLNFLLAVLNLFPGYPLDGGRVLRAYLWRRETDLNEATVMTGRCGQIIAAALIFFGVFFIVSRGDLITGFWSALVGFFLFDAARGIIRDIKKLESRIVEDIMRLPISVAPEIDVLHFVDQILPFNRRAIFLVAENRQFYGILALEDLKILPRGEWRKTKIREVMRPITPDYFVETDTSVAEAQALMRENGIGALGVIDAQGNLVGFLYGKVIKNKRL